MTLRVGTREFIGEGTTAQQAKHNAASKALKVMKTLPMPENAATCTQGGEGDPTGVLVGLSLPCEPIVALPKLLYYHSKLSIKYSAIV